MTVRQTGLDGMESESSRIHFLFVLIGAVGGIDLGMLFSDRSPTDYGRVRLETSIPFTCVGVLLGAFVGLAVSAIYEKKPRTRWFITLISAAFLAGGIGAIHGWLGGDAEATGYNEHRHFTRRAMGLGAAIGSLLGLLLGTI